MPVPGAPDAAEVAVCALGETAWHAAAHAGLGVPWYLGDGVAWTDRFAHLYLLGGVTLAPRPALPPTMRSPVRDSFGTLTGAFGPDWNVEPADPWMLRPPGPLDVPAPSGVDVAPTHDPLLFEHTAFVAVAGTPPQRPGELHPPGSERVPGVHLLLARRDGRPIGTALAVVHPAGVHVSGVGVVPAERGRGVASALVAAAVHRAPDRPATLASSAMAVSTYTRLGFRRVGGRALQWSRD